MKRNYTVGRSWECLLKQEKANLRLVTIIIGAIRVQESDLSSPARVSEICTESAEMISAFKDDWLGITRGRYLAGLMWRGVFELDLIREIPPDGHHHATLADMSCDVRSLNDDERILVVHTHFVAAFLGEHDDGGEGKADELRSVIQSAWSGRWQTQVKNLRSNQTVREAITKIYSYCHKQRLQYSTGGMNDAPVKYGESYGWSWSRFVLKVYDSFKIEFRSKK